MNSLEIKKRAFMAAVTRNYGFVRVKSGALPLTLESCIRANLINYKISGNVGTNLFNMNLITNSKYETHPDENYFDVKAYSITAMSPSNFMVMSGLKAGDTVTTARTKEAIQDGEGSNGAWGRITLLSKVSGVSSVVLCDLNENIGTVTIPDDFNPNNYYGLVIYGMNKTDSILRIHNMQIVKGSYTEETMPEYEPYKCVGDLDSASGKYKIPVTVSGKNLFNKSQSSNSGIASETEVRGVAGMALLNDEVRRIFKPSTTYTMIYDAEVTYIPDLDEYTLNPSGSANWIGFILYSGKTGYAAVTNTLSARVEPVKQGDKYHTCKTFITPEKIDDTDGNYTMRFYTRLYEKNSDGTRQNGGVTFTNIQIIEGDYTGDNEPDYEMYKEPQTTNIFVSAPLKIGESIEYKADNLPDIAVSDGTNIISVGTEVSPSAFEAEYYSNIKEE